MSNYISSTSPILVWVDVEGQQQSKALPEAEFYIGRHPANDILVPDPTVSRRHATITYRNLRHYIIDQSTSGTFLNGERIHSNENHLLNDQDVITIGGTSFTFLDPFKTIGKFQFDSLVSGSRPAAPTGVIPAAQSTTGTLTIDLNTGEVRRDGRDVSLTPKEFLLLKLLYEHQERACTRAEIRRTVWSEREGDDEDAVSDEEIDGLVRRLRAKIEPDRANPRHIITVRQVRGYRFKP